MSAELAAVLQTAVRRSRKSNWQRQAASCSRELDRFQHRPGRGRLVQDVEVNARNVGVDELLNLGNGKVDTHLELPLSIVLLGFQLADERSWQLRSAQRRDSFDLRQVG